MDHEVIPLAPVLQTHPNFLAMNGWHALPNELIGDIAIHLHQSDLRNLSLVSYRLHDIAEPILYSHIEFKDAESYTDSTAPHTTASSSLRVGMRLFMRTLIRRPEFAERVRSFDYGPSADHHSVRTCCSDLDGRTIVSSAIHTFTPSPQAIESFYGSLSHVECREYAMLAKASVRVGLGTGWIPLGDGDPCHSGGGLGIELCALYLLILHHLPKLRVLKLSSGAAQAFTKDILLNRTKFGLDLPVALSSLTNLDCDHRPFPTWSDSLRSSTSRWLPFVRPEHLIPLKNIQALHLTYATINPCKDENEPALFLARTLPFTCLEFHRCRFPPGALNQLIKLPRTLRSFIFVDMWYRLAYFSSTLGLFSCSKAVDYLSEHASTLTTLHMFNEMTPEESSHLEGKYYTSLLGKVGSLRHFSALTNLRVGVANLFPDSAIPTSSLEPLHIILPSTIVTLAIDLCPVWSAARLVSATGYPSKWETERKSFPSLSSFTINRFVKYGELDNEDMDGVDDTVLSEMGRVGITFLPLICRTIAHR